MTTRNLDYLFRPRSVAVIGASEQPHSLGAIIMRNLLDAQFAGPVWPVNPRYSTISGRAAYHRVGDLPSAPELAVICTPADTVPRLIAELGERGTRAAVVLTAGLGRGKTPDGRTLSTAMLEAA